MAEYIISSGVTSAGLVLTNIETATVLSGGLLISATTDRNTAVICSGGTAKATVVKAGGKLIVSAGVASDTFIEPNGSVTVLSGASAVNTTVEYLGQLFVANGGTATSTTVSKGGTAQAEGTLNIATINNGCIQLCNSGAATSVTTVNGGSIDIKSGATANGITFRYAMSKCRGIAHLNVNGGGVASNTVVNGDNGDIKFTDARDTNAGPQMFVRSAGSAVKLTVSKGGPVRVESGATLTSASTGEGGEIWS